MSGGPEHAVVLVLRAWAESPGVLLVRITAAPVWSEGEEQVVVVTGVDAALAAVRVWLEEVSEGA